MLSVIMDILLLVIIVPPSGLVHSMETLTGVLINSDSTTMHDILRGVSS